MEPDVPRKTTSSSTAADSRSGARNPPCASRYRVMRRQREYRSSGLLRSLTLLRTFLIASAVILALGAVALSSTLSSDLRDLALADNARDVGAYTDAVLAPTSSAGTASSSRRASARRLAATVRLPARRPRHQRLLRRGPSGLLDDTSRTDRKAQVEPGSEGAPIRTGSRAPSSSIRWERRLRW